MDGWQLWKRVWYGVNRKKHGPRHYAVASRTRSAPVSGSYAPHGRYVLGARHYSFHSHGVAPGISQRPKVLLDVDCSNLLTGGSRQYENFSSTCWLEDHLHHFGEHVSLSAQASTSSFHWNTQEDDEEEEDQEEGGDPQEGSDFLPPPPHRMSQDDSSPSRLTENAGREEERREEEEEEEEERGRVGDRDVGAQSSVPVVTNVGDVSRRRRHPPLRRTFAVSEPPPYITEPPPSYEEAIAGNSLIDCGNSDFMW